MFAKFLLPEMVLFGEPLSNNLKCKHPCTYKDGELVVHQSVARSRPVIVKNIPGDDSYDEYEEEDYGGYGDEDYSDD